MKLMKALFTAILLLSTGTTVPAWGQTGSIKTVWIILMENHNWSQIKGSKSAPYINSTLLPMASHAEQYFNPPGNHPSLPNYLWLEAGTNFGVTDDNAPSSHHFNVTHSCKIKPSPGRPIRKISPVQRAR